MWRFADRYDLQMLIQSVRAAARGPVARLVAEGGRNTHEWTSQKAELLRFFDEAGITAAFMDPEHGGYLEGPKNLALALIAFELAWVDAGAATCSMAGHLALAPIHERGTEEQKARYMRLATPPGPGEDREILRGAFALTEPLPYVGVETGILGGKARVAEWEEGKEPILQVDKRGRFITNMGFANFVTAAVDSADPRIKGSCMVILEENDPGLFDRGAPTRKLVHQLSSTRDPVFSLRVPASRIVGGYTIKDGVLIPNYSHSEIIEAVFRRTRVTVGLMTAAKLLSAVEPIIRYHRTRFRGMEAGGPGSPRYELGIQQKEDATHRLVDVWAAGEASASLGFAAARLFDELEPVEKTVREQWEKQGLKGRAQFRALMQAQKAARELLRLRDEGPKPADAERAAQLEADPAVRYALLDSLANVYCPACKLWNTGHGTNMMREAVSLMGGYGITEDCPGFLAHKWMDAQLEATYEGPEAVQRLQLSLTMTSPLFLDQFRRWIRDLRRISAERPETGACALATAMELWLYALEHLQKAVDANGAKLFHKNRQGVTFPMADALCWLLAAREFILDTLELVEKGPEHPALQGGAEGTAAFYTDLCWAHCGRVAGEVGRICAELVFGYNAHPTWSDGGGPEAQASQPAPARDGGPGIDEALWAGLTDVPAPPKAGPCVRPGGLDPFLRIRSRLDMCMTGSRLAKDRAARALTRVTIPEAPDYPA